MLYGCVGVDGQSWKGTLRTLRSIGFIIDWYTDEENTIETKF